MQNLLIIEPHFDGHRGVYVTWITHGAIERGYRVTLATLSTSKSHATWGALNKLPSDQFDSVILESSSVGRSRTGSVSLAVNEVRYWRLLKRLFEKSNQLSPKDVVIVPFLDYCTNAIAILGSPFDGVFWCGIVMRQAFHFEKMGVKAARPRFSRLKYLLFRRLLSSPGAKAIFSIDETLVKFFSSCTDRDALKLVYLPDPADRTVMQDKVSARAVLGIDVSAIIILIYGGISERKGVLELLTAIGATGCSDKVEVLLVGSQTDGIRKFLISKELDQLNSNGRIHQMDKFVDDDEEDLAFGAADIVWLGYREFDLMSGVLVRAGQKSLPVIATSSGLIGNITSNHGSGLVVNISNVGDVQKAINLLSSSSELRREKGRNGKVRFSQHTVKHFTDTILDAIKVA